MNPSATSVIETTPTSSASPIRAIVSGALLCGVLDINGAFLQAWVQNGVTPERVLKGVAGGLLGRAAAEGGPAIAALGLAMHFGVATCATLLFYALSRRLPVLRQANVLLVGALYGLAFFALMNFATLPLLSFFRSLYLNSTPYWVGPMRWPQALVHMVCVGLPIAWCIRRFGPR